MSIDKIASKSLKRSAPRVTHDQKTWDWMLKYCAEMMAHCAKFQRPQDWELLAVIEADMVSPEWKEFRGACMYCDADQPHLLDKNGVRSGISKEAGTWNHSAEDEWWPCVALSESPK